MTELLGEVEIPNCISGGLDTARIMMGLDHSHLLSFHDGWTPMIQSAVSEVRTSCTTRDGKLNRATMIEELGSRNIQDGHWDWDQKWKVFGPDLSKVFFAVECDGAAQALMVVDNSRYVCRDPACQGQGLIYIEYVAVAPWNRSALVGKPSYRGLGKVLVGTAVSLSIEEELAGRVGLHALPQSVGFYAEGCGMTSYGPDDSKEGLPYFEMTENQAKTFLGDK